MYTFNGGPLTSAEQHALLSEYDWRTGQLTVAEIAEAAKNVSDDEARAILFNEPQITEGFVKSDGTVVPAIYVQLRNRINRISLGIGSEINENVFDFLMQEITPEEAAFYCGVNFYHSLAFAHGILEFTLDRYCAGAEGKEDYVNGIFSIRGDDYGYVSRNLGSAMYFPVPVNESIVAETKILPYFDWDEIIQRSIDAGMVIQVMNTKQCDVICSCHGDCCGILRGYMGMDGDVGNLKYVSHYELVVDTDTCIKCGTCADRCPVSTITMDEETGLPVVGNVCVRCGQCAYVCPTESRKLTALAAEDRFEIPNDMIDDYYVKSLERAKRGMIVDFDPAKA